MKRILLQIPRDRSSYILDLSHSMQSAQVVHGILAGKRERGWVWVACRDWRGEVDELEK